MLAPCLEPGQVECLPIKTAIIQEQEYHWVRLPSAIIILAMGITEIILWLRKAGLADKLISAHKLNTQKDPGKIIKT